MPAATKVDQSEAPWMVAMQTSFVKDLKKHLPSEMKNANMRLPVLFSPLRSFCESKIQELAKKRDQAESLIKVFESDRDHRFKQSEIALMDQYDEIKHSIKFHENILEEMMSTLVNIDQDVRKSSIKTREVREDLTREIVSTVLDVQDVLSQFDNAVVREDFSTGSCGSVNMSVKDIDRLREEKEALRATRLKGTNYVPVAEYQEALSKSANMWVDTLSELKKAEKTSSESFGDFETPLGELVYKVQQCSYFGQKKTLKKPKDKTKTTENKKKKKENTTVNEAVAVHVEADKEPVVEDVEEKQVQDVVPDEVPEVEDDTANVSPVSQEQNEVQDAPAEEDNFVQNEVEQEPEPATQFVAPAQPRNILGSLQTRAVNFVQDEYAPEVPQTGFTENHLPHLSNGFSSGSMAPSFNEMPAPVNNVASSMDYASENQLDSYNQFNGNSATQGNYQNGLQANTNQQMDINDNTQKNSLFANNKPQGTFPAAESWADDAPEPFSTNGNDDSSFVEVRRSGSDRFASRGGGGEFGNRGFRKNEYSRGGMNNRGRGGPGGFESRGGSGYSRPYRGDFQGGRGRGFGRGRGGFEGRGGGFDGGNNRGGFDNNRGGGPNGYEQRGNNNFGNNGSGFGGRPQRGNNYDRSQQSFNTAK